VTVLDLKPNPQDISAFYLENIYKLQFSADANPSQSPVPVTPATPPPFSPPNYVIWVNSLWFLSLTISLTCAMLATMLQQWARRYLRITQKPRYTPHDGARIRAFFARGVKTLRFSVVTGAITALIHFSLFLFFIGLLIYLRNNNFTVFCAMVWWVTISTMVYLVITIMPILRVDSPYYSPLSPLVFRLYAVLLYSICCSKHLRRLATTYFSGLSRGIEKMAGKKVIKESLKVDSFILKWTFDAHAFASDDQQDQFFEHIYGFYSSNKVVRNPLRCLATLGSRRFSSALVAFLNRTLSSSSVSDLDKVKRFIMCVKITDETQGTVLRDLFSEAAADHSLVRNVEVGRTLRSPNRADEGIGLCAQTIVAEIIANVEERDDLWIELAADQLGKSEDDIRRYLAQGNDSVLLANWIYMARQILDSSSGNNRSMASDAASCILQPSSRFDIRNTLPELQRDFCSLWNEIVSKAQKSGNGSVPHFIIFLLRNLYLDLHQDIDDTPAPSFDKFMVSSYPLCNNPHPHSPSHETVTADISLPPLILAHSGSLPQDLFPPGDAFDAPPHVTSSPISSETNLAPDPPEQVAGTSMTPQGNVTPVDPHAVVLDSPPPAALFPGPSNSQLTGDPHLPVGSSVNNFDNSPPRQASSSSSPIATSLLVHSQIFSLLDPGATATDGILRADEDTHISSQSELSGQLQQSLAEPVVSTNVVTTTSGFGNRESSQSPT
jgi:Family of unknown function (DUF6535)